MNAPKGTLIAYATAPGKVAADGDGSNGVYTARLIEAIKAPSLPVEEVFKRVRIDVTRDTGEAQTPWEASSLVGNFYFNGPTTVLVNPPAATDREALYWQSVWDSNDPAQLQAYLDQYPKGEFSGVARAKLAALSRPSAATVPAAGPPPSAGPGATRAFDGNWTVSLACPQHTDGAKGYSYRFPAEVRDGRLRGSYRSRTTSAALDLEGPIGSDGRSLLQAKGVVGASSYAVGRLPEGSDVDYPVDARFEGGRGTGSRMKGRVCNFTFTKR